MTRRRSRRSNCAAAVAEAERNRVAMRWKARNVTASQTFRKLWRERTSTINMCAEDPKLCRGDPEKF